MDQLVVLIVILLIGAWFPGGISAMAGDGCADSFRQKHCSR